MLHVRLHLVRVFGPVGGLEALLVLTAHAIPHNAGQILFVLLFNVLHVRTMSFMTLSLSLEGL